MNLQLLLIASLFCLNVSAQYSADSVVLKKKVLKTVIKTNDGKRHNSFLVNITDSTITTYNEPVRFSSVMPDNLTTQFSYPTINKMQVWRKGRVGRGILWGAVTGAIIGIGAGFIEGDDPVDTWFGISAGEKAAIYGTVLSLSGTIIGAIVGAAAKKKFIIRGKKEKLRQMRENILGTMKMKIHN